MTRRPFAHVNPFTASLGLELWGDEAGRCEIRLDMTDAHANSWGVAHGGVVMTLLDAAMAQAARTAAGHGSDADFGVVTVEMKTSFLRPAERLLRAVPQVLHASATLVFCDARVIDDTERLCAHGSGTFKVLRGLPVDGRRLRAVRAGDSG